MKANYLIVLVHRPHAPLTLKLCDDLSGVLYDDLVRLECPVASNTVSAIGGLDHLHANVVLATGLRSMLELAEITVSTLWTKSAVAAVAFVEHVPVLAVLITACILFTHAGGKLQFLVRFPLTSRVANKNV